MFSCGFTSGSRIKIGRGKLSQQPAYNKILSELHGALEEWRGDVWSVPIVPAAWETEQGLLRPGIPA